METDKNSSALDFLLTVQDVAKLLKVSQRTVRRWSEQGRIPTPIRYSKTCIRWRASDIQAHLNNLNKG